MHEETLIFALHNSGSYTVAGVLAIAFSVIFTTLKFYATSSELTDIPTIGPSAPGLSYLGAFRLLFNASGIIQEGYDKHKNALFKIADFRSWTVVASGAQYIEDIRKACPDVLTFEATIDEALHCLGPDMRRSHFHVAIVQNQLTRELSDSFHDIRDEIVAAFGDLIVPENQDWFRVAGLNTVLEVVTRASHRLFVGLPLCRNPGYVSFTMQFALDISKAASFIRLFPPWFKQYAGRPFANVPKALDRMMVHLRPLVEERKQNILKYGRNYPGKPQDLLTWFMEEVDGDTEEDKLRHIALHFLTVNFGSVYTTTMSFTQALYHIAAHPEIIEPLREEIEAVLSEEGWTKYAMGKMRKLDSFMKESQRLTGLAAVSTYRRVLKPFTFSDGTQITPGTTIAVAAHSTHVDPEVYPNAEEFDAFRFSNMEGEAGYFVTPSVNYLPFGVGRHLCPGRFFTVVIMKAMMAHLILNYDIKLEREGERPKASWFVTDNIPNEVAGVMLKQREKYHHM